MGLFWLLGSWLGRLLNPESPEGYSQKPWGKRWLGRLEKDMTEGRTFRWMGGRTRGLVTF